MGEWVLFCGTITLGCTGSVPQKKHQGGILSFKQQTLTRSSLKCIYSPITRRDQHFLQDVFFIHTEVHAPVLCRIFTCNAFFQAHFQDSKSNEPHGYAGYEIKTSPVWSWQQAQCAKYFTLYSDSHDMYRQCWGSLTT